MFWIGLDKNSASLPTTTCQNTACTFDWLNVDPPATFNRGPGGYYVQGRRGVQNYVYADGLWAGKLQIRLVSGSVLGKVLCEYRCEPRP